MTDMTTDLVKRLEAGETGREIDAEVCWRFGEHGPDDYGMPLIDDRVFPVTTSLDAAVALVERVKPEAYIEMSGPRKYLNIPTPVPNKWLAKVDDFRGWAATPAAALIAALLKAKGAGDE